MVVGALGLGAPPANAQINILDTVRQRGALNCRVNAGLPGFSQSDAKGNWRGLDVDYCKAIAAAVLGDPNKVSYLPMSTKNRFAALHSGEIDVLVRNSTWTSGRDSSLGLSFAGVNYYDGQGFIVKASRGVRSVKELDGAAICALAYTTTELNLASYFKASNMSYKDFHRLLLAGLTDALRSTLDSRHDSDGPEHLRLVPAPVIGEPIRSPRWRALPAAPPKRRLSSLVLTGALLAIG